MPYNYQSKVAIHLSNLINPASNKSEGLYKIIMWPGLRRNSWFFLETQIAQIVSQIMATTGINLCSSLIIFTLDDSCWIVGTLLRLSW